MSKPRLWQHKENNKKFRVMPWWECIDLIVSEQDIAVEASEGPKIKIGALIQIGWLLETEHGAWLGVGPMAAEEFKDLGEWMEAKEESQTHTQSSSEGLEDEQTPR